MSPEALRERLCSDFCKDLRFVQRPDSLAVALPMAGRDGDNVTAYVSDAVAGWRISDKGATLMRLSYENDVAKLLQGARRRLFETVLRESGLQEDDGEIYINVAADELTRGLFALGQGVVRVEDVGLWTRSRVESSFTDDLRRVILRAVGPERVQENYEVPDLPSAENYPVDFYVETGRDPLYIFGVQNRDKARLATIILQHLAKAGQRFDSMVVYADVDDIPKADQKRLMVAANDAVPSIAEVDGIQAKIRHRLAAA